jgi:hypothetical protein
MGLAKKPERLATVTCKGEARRLLLHMIGAAELVVQLL